MKLHAEPPAGPLAGAVTAAGDKSISHRALILAGLARGESRIEGLLDSADVRATAAAMSQLGARLRSVGRETWVRGLGGEGLKAVDGALDMGNSGTAMRLLAGVLAGQPFASVLTGDASLLTRPMRRIIRPLVQMGARIEATQAGTAPLRIGVSGGMRGIDYESPVASAQVKSCVLLAGLFAQGRTSVTEPGLSRDHTERMLPLFGVELHGGIAVQGGSPLEATRVRVPADPSSAAFLVAAALAVPGSDLILEQVGFNDTRTAFYRVLREMGADLSMSPGAPFGNEPVGDIRVRYSGTLRGIEVPPEWLPAMIDEVPVLLALAALADGVTTIRGAEELRVKESDRLAVMGAGLRATGIEVDDHPDGLDVRGGRPRAATVHARDDHRCAMSFAVLGQAVAGGLGIEGAGYIGTSYPDFLEHMARVGASVVVADP